MGLKDQPEVSHRGGYSGDNEDLSQSLTFGDALWFVYIAAFVLLISGL
jgi:hypothetical protein